MKGMRDEQLALQRQRLAKDPERVAALEQGLAEGGYEGAQRRLGDLLAARYEKAGGVPTAGARRTFLPVGIALRYVDGGDYSRALDWLEKACEVRAHCDHLDTDESGPASACLATLPGEEVLAVSVQVVCELMAGASHAAAPRGELERLSRLCDALLVRYPDERFAPEYARLLTSIRGAGGAGGAIDTMDLLIATAAVLDGAPLLTRNRRHFARVAPLTVTGY